MTNVPPARKPTAPQQIAAAIKESILNGTLRPGDRLPSEPELAEQFGTSRPTLRSALAELCANDVLTVRRGRSGGYRVSDISLDLLAPRIKEFITLSLTVKTLQLPQVYEVRRALELLIAELAAERRTPEALERLEQLTSETQRNAPRTATAAVDLDLRYHAALASCTGNPLLVGLEAAMDSAYRQFLLSPPPKRISPRETLRGLRELTEAVRAGDAAAARDVMDRHLAYSDEFFVDGGAASRR